MMWGEVALHRRLHWGPVDEGSLALAHPDEPVAGHDRLVGGLDPHEGERPLGRAPGALVPSELLPPLDEATERDLVLDPVGPPALDRERVVPAPDLVGDRVPVPAGHLGELGDRVGPAPGRGGVGGEGGLSGHERGPIRIPPGRSPGRGKGLGPRRMRNAEASGNFHNSREPGGRMPPRRFLVRPGDPIPGAGDVGPGAGDGVTTLAARKEGQRRGGPGAVGCGAAPSRRGADGRTGRGPVPSLPVPAYITTPGF